MKYLQPTFTMDQYKPNPDYCCEACVFGKGEHSEWCECCELIDPEGKRHVFPDFFATEMIDLLVQGATMTEGTKERLYRSMRRLEVSLGLPVSGFEPHGDKPADAQVLPDLTT